MVKGSRGQVKLKAIGYLGTTPDSSLVSSLKYEGKALVDKGPFYRLAIANANCCFARHAVPSRFDATLHIADDGLRLFRFQ